MPVDQIFILPGFANKTICCLVWIACLSTIGSAQEDGPNTTRPERDNGTPKQVLDDRLIFGAVEGKDGLPVADARVWLVGGKYGAPEVLAETTSDNDGQFSFHDLPDEGTLFRNPGVLGVWAQHPTAGLGWFSGLYKHKRKPIGIRLGPTAKSTGQLVGPEGQPLAGVKITPRILGGARPNHYGTRSGVLSPELSRRLSTVTNENGEFEIGNMPLNGVVHCDVDAPGFDELTVNWNLNKPLVIKLDPGVSFSGRVKWPEEVRIPEEVDFQFGTLRITGGLLFQPDGTVSSDGTNIAYETESTYTVEINKNGHFRLDHLAPGRYYVSAEFSPRLPLHLSGSRQLVVTPEKVIDDFELVTEKAFRVSGRVVGFQTKKPVPNATVQIFQRVPGGLVPTQRVTTDEDGKYSAFTKMGNTTLQVSEAPPEFIPAASSFDSQFSSLRNLTFEVTGDTFCPDIELDSACDVVLDVFDENGKPAVGAIVHIATVAGFPAGQDHQTEQRTDAEGKYIARRVTVNDTLPICVRTPTAISKLNLVVTPGELNGPVRIDLSPDHGFRFRCQVVDRDGEPVDGARVNVETYYYYTSKWFNSERESAISGRAGEGVTGPDGYFESGPLWPDRDYRFTVEADGYDMSEPPRVTGKAGEVVELKPVVLSTVKATRIAGIVVDSVHQPVEGVRVYAAGSSYLLATAQTDTSGHFELNELAADVRYVFADGGPHYRLGGSRVGNQQPLEITIRSVESAPVGVRENRVLPREEQLAAAEKLIEQVWSLPANVQIGSQREFLMAMVQIDPSRAMEKALFIGRGYESYVRAEQAIRTDNEDPKQAMQFLEAGQNQVGTLTACRLGTRLAKSGDDQDKQMAIEFAELAVKLSGADTAFHSKLAALFTALGQHEKAQALIAKVLDPIDLDNPTEEQKQILTMLAPAVAPYDFEKARSFASLAEEGFSRTYALANVAIAIVTTDHEKAIREINALTGDSNAPNIRDESRFRAAWLLFANHPDVAIELVDQCEKSGNRAQALGRLAVRVAERDQPQAWRMIESALAIHRKDPGLYNGWSSSGGAGPFAAAIAWQAHQVGYPDMESVIWQVLSSCRANPYRGQDRLTATVKTARILALVDKIAARDLLNSVADKTEQLPRDGGINSLYEQWLQAWLLVDFGRGTRLLGDELEELKTSAEKDRHIYKYGSVYRLLVAPSEEQYQMLLWETGLWKLDEDESEWIR